VGVDLVLAGLSARNRASGGGDVGATHAKLLNDRAGSLNLIDRAARGKQISAGLDGFGGGL
jgi:hypothetical protein